MKHLAALMMSLVLVPMAAWADPPGRVGRLAWIEGEVSVFADPERGWERAGVNSHLTSQNSVWTEPGARAEVRAGSIALRLDEATQLDIPQLDDEVLLAHVMRGSLAVRVSYFEKGETITITTPSARFQVRGNGRYRVDADAETGESRLTVFSGNARLETSGSYVHVDTGRSVRVSGGDRPGYELEAAREGAIDAWALARDARFAQGQASRYVSPRMTGWEDLDAYGEWRTEPDYGAVWYPARVDVGWAPYRYGRWTWVRPWGWSWVDDAPWGYAPFHYGRWVVVGNRWGWYPGRYAHRPVWAPALVGWVGTPGWNVSISTGPLNVVGWYPLSPFDRYEPWYPTHTTYVNNINNVVIVNRRPSHLHDNRDRGATVVAREHFVSHRPVQSGIARVPREVIAAQPVTRGAAVLPSQDEWRARRNSAETAPSFRAPRAPAGGEGVPATRPGAPVAGAPLAKPQPAPSAAPIYPESPPARLAKPVPQDNRERSSGQRATEPRGSETRSPRAVEKPATPAAPAAPSSQPVARPPATPPVPSTQPVARPPATPPAPSAPSAQPVARSPAAPAAPSSRPATRPVEKPAAPTAPSSQPAPRPVEKPAQGQERPAARSSEKPAKAIE